MVVNKNLQPDWQYSFVMHLTISTSVMSPDSSVHLRRIACSVVAQSQYRVTAPGTQRNTRLFGSIEKHY